MIGRAVQFFFTLMEKFERPQVYHYCVRCEKKFLPEAVTEMFCSRRCRKATTRAPRTLGRIYFRPGKDSSDS